MFGRSMSNPFFFQHLSTICCFIILCNTFLAIMQYTMPPDTTSTALPRTCFGEFGESLRHESFMIFSTCIKKCQGQGKGFSTLRNYPLLMIQCCIPPISAVSFGCPRHNSKSSCSRSSSSLLRSASRRAISETSNPWCLV